MLADTSHAINQERPAEIAEAVNRMIEETEGVHLNSTRIVHPARET